jgi:hypothetical protein
MLRIPKVSLGGLPPAARQQGTHFAIGLASFKNYTNGKWLPPDFLIDFKSSEDVSLAN